MVDPRIIKDPKVRVAVVRESHRMFFGVYFPHYLKYKTAPFQNEIFTLTENESIRNVVIAAFRGSAKSTIITLSYAIWAILGKQQKKFVLILGQTQHQARQHLNNLKAELERNELLRADLGPFEESNDEWRSTSLVLPKYRARITAASSEQSIRGIRHGSHRPDLIICDDVEDLASAKTRENRDKAYNWLTGEVMPAGDQNTRMIAVGNFLHEDSLLMRLKKDIQEGRLDGVFRSYPLINNREEVLWPGKFPDRKAIESLRLTVPSNIAWQREYLLKIIIEEGRLVQPEWIHYYDDLPNRENTDYRYSATGIDLAISQSETADYTAMASAHVHEYGDAMKVYILPNPINERLTSLETFERGKAVCETIAGGSRSFLFVEEVGYQGSLIEQFKKAGLPAEGVKVHGQDKRARLNLVTSLIQSGQVLFPKKGAERLIEQLVGFGYEKHDDLADAFAILLHKIMERNKNRPQPLILTERSKLSENLLNKEF